MRLLSSIFLLFFGLLCYAMVEKQNQVMQMRMDIPLLEKQIEQLEQKNAEILFALTKNRAPSLLMHLAKQEKFAYLVHPFSTDVLAFQESLGFVDSYSTGKEKQEKSG